MTKKWINRTIRGLSFTSAMFIFQACYGTPQDFGNDILLKGQVTSLQTGEPLEGIKVEVEHSGQYEVTNENGEFSLYTYADSHFKMQFSEVDTVNVNYTVKDTLIAEGDASNFLNIKLQSK